MALKKENVKRVFLYKGDEMDDPNPNLTVEEVKRHFSGIYPEITTADIEGPKIKGGRHEYSFKTIVGTKG